MEYLRICEAVLNRLNINYRMCHLQNGGFFMCRNSDVVFNMSVDLHGHIQLCRFVRSGLSPEYIGQCRACPLSEDSQASIRFEVSAECDLLCYSDQLVNFETSDLDGCLERQLTEYLSIFS